MAKVQRVEFLKIRALSANFRFEPVPEDEATGHGWADRKEAAIALIKKWSPSVIFAQECSSQIRADLLAGLGTNWGYWRNGNVSVWADKAVHERVSYDNTITLPTQPDADGSPGDPRRLVWVKFRHKITARYWYGAASHFSAQTDPIWPRQQMEAVVAALPDIRNTILGVDMNSSVMTGLSPRSVARDAGLTDLRAKFGEWSIRDATANTYTGWSETIFGSEWIDDIFTGGNFQPYYGRVVLTEEASDHNWPLVSSIQLNDETVQ